MGLQADLVIAEVGDLAVNSAYISIDDFHIKSKYVDGVKRWEASVMVQIHTSRAAKIAGSLPVFSDFLQATMPAQLPDQEIIGWLYGKLKQLKYPTAVDSPE